MLDWRYLRDYNISCEVERFSAYRGLPIDQRSLRAFRLLIWLWGCMQGAALIGSGSAAPAFLAPPPPPPRLGTPTLPPPPPTSVVGSQYAYPRGGPVAPPPPPPPPVAAAAAASTSYTFPVPFHLQQQQQYQAPAYTPPAAPAASQSTYQALPQPSYTPFYQQAATAVVAPLPQQQQVSSLCTSTWMQSAHMHQFVSI